MGFVDDQLNKLSEEILECTKCKLHSSGCHTPGTGKTGGLMLIGEANGIDESIQGLPFVGRSGQLLTRIMEVELGLKRSDVYIANIVKCRPTIDLKGEKDRPPDEEEVAACSPYLEKQIDLVSPRVIVTLGSPAMKHILGVKDKITNVRGTWGEYRGIPVMPTYHPSYLLRKGVHSPEYRLAVHDLLRAVTGKPL